MQLPLRIVGKLIAGAGALALLLLAIGALIHEPFVETQVSWRAAMLTVFCGVVLYSLGAILRNQKR